MMKNTIIILTLSLLILSFLKCSNKKEQISNENIHKIKLILDKEISENTVLTCDSIINKHKKYQNNEVIMHCMIKKLEVYNKWNDYENFSDYSKIAKKYAKKIGDKNATLDILFLKATMLKKLGLYSEALNIIDEALEITSKMKISNEILKQRVSLLSLKSFVMGDMDETVSKIIKIRLQVIQEIEKHSGNNLAISHPANAYSNLAISLLQNKDKDSALIYFNKAEKIALKQQDFISLYNIYINMVNLYLNENDYNNSMIISQKLDTLFSSNKTKISNADLALYHKQKATLYKGLREYAKYIDHNEKYNFYRKKINQKNNKLLTQSLKYNENKIKIEEDIWTKISLYHYIIIFTLSATAIFVIFFLKRKLKKENQHKSKKEEKIKKLQQQLNNAFEEIVEMAKKDDPNFLTRFIEVYPDFYASITKKHPELTVGELRFCAFIYLNFTTKEIAYYLHLSTRSIETKKYRLRKKVSLSSDQDLHKWLLSFQ